MIGKVLKYIIKLNHDIRFTATSTAICKELQTKCREEITINFLTEVTGPFYILDSGSYLWGQEYFGPSPVMTRP